MQNTIIALDLSAIITDNVHMNYDYEKIETAINLLDGRLKMNNSGNYSLVVCGGAALNAMHLVQRTTKDVDIVALIDANNQLDDPAPLPEELLAAASEVADTLQLPQDWLNNGPVAVKVDCSDLACQMAFKPDLPKDIKAKNYLFTILAA